LKVSDKEQRSTGVKQTIAALHNHHYFDSFQHKAALCPQESKAKGPTKIIQIQPRVASLRVYFLPPSGSKRL